MGFGIAYQYGMRKLLMASSSLDHRTCKEGKVLSAQKKEENWFLEVEFEHEKKKYDVWVPIYRLEDCAAVGKLVSLRIDFDHLEKSEIDWEKENQRQSKNAIFRIVIAPSLALIFSGLLIFLSGLKRG